MLPAFPVSLQSAFKESEVLLCDSLPRSHGMRGGRPSWGGMPLHRKSHRVDVALFSVIHVLIRNVPFGRIAGRDDENTLVQRGQKAASLGVHTINKWQHTGI